ncbi:MAG TPA: prepilin-type N-terminal cleavage/methylation domain-containing protein [Thiolapillus brandeum]|uniref:Prepilin-type N-terminal cleavage/methylation domain-containing protein n=1 Tax=Thiolapillus brandeum TaxID=1076588 RepID=A0A831NRY8_9GAMM|nr:prepilin-type N-terminal cleavage/methylation domain-containing protein [Thiolapillus brandeum]
MAALLGVSNVFGPYTWTSYDSNLKGNPTSNKGKIEMNKRKHLEVPSDYIKRLIITPLLSGILLVNIIIITTFIMTDGAIGKVVTDYLLYAIAGVETLLIFFYLYFAVHACHRIAGPMRAVKKTLEQVGDGDLTATLHFRKGDFNPDLPGQFNVCVGNLRGKIATAKNLVERISENSLSDKQQAELISRLQSTLDDFKTEVESAPPPAPKKQTAPKQTGFTLVELLVVVTVVSVLAMIALPSYLNYHTRAKVSEALGVAGQIKKAIAETYLSLNDWPANTANAGLPAIGAHTQYVQSVTVEKIDDEHGKFTIALDINGLEGKTLVFTGKVKANGGMDWVCNGSLGDHDKGTLEEKFRPPICR